MKRRQFSQWVSLGVIASSLPVAIAACQSSPPSMSDSPSSSSPSPTFDSTPREDGFAAVGTVAQLDEKGFISDKAFFAGSVLVIRDPNDASSLLAVDSLCTHQACSVTWESDESIFDCRCHGSTFSADGSVINGPAQTPLGTFEAIIDGDLVLVKAV